MKRPNRNCWSGNEILFLGLDLGSVSLNTIILNSRFEILGEFYDYTHGRPFHVLHKRMSGVIETLDGASIGGLAITGSAGKLAQELLGGVFVNEIIAQATSVGELYHDTQTVIEIGGEDSKLIILERDLETGRSRLSDFEMNSICAAGTGSFLDQQAKRIGVSIEREFGELALKSAHPPRIAGRCSVFAKSDMIHLQQIATPLQDIVAGLCFAMARNFRSTIARSRDLKKPVVFSGGVAANAGMIKAFREVLSLDKGELIIPEYHASMGAIGAVMYAFSKMDHQEPFQGLDGLVNYLGTGGMFVTKLPRLVDPQKNLLKSANTCLTDKEKLPVYLGLDIGSLSTNVVLIDQDHHVIARRYLPTAGKPLEAIRRGLNEIYEEVGEKVTVIGAGTTGSGRYLTGDFIGADSIQNEITAQATAAIDFDPTVDTIFEIGGQDSKYIKIENGVVVDFEMNKVCAAGTGSFLEEQAEKLKINIVKEFGDRALSCDCPVKLGDRCTVFMESDLNSFMQRGVENDNLVGGLAYSIVYNYLQKVVGERRVGNKIFFQGGVANNKAVVAAFEQVVGKKITIPPHFDVTGAIGAAILAQRNIPANEQTKFKGFNVGNVPYQISLFTCNACSNQCEIRKVKIEGEKKPLFYGGRCEKYETSSRKKAAIEIPNLFQQRRQLILGDFKSGLDNSKISIGIPRALMIFYQQFPFWKTFFHELGFQVVLSDESDQQLVTRSLESISTETCLPVELMHGHVLDLLRKKVDYIFIPFIVNAKARAGNPTSNSNCPWIQSYPFMVKAAQRNKIPAEKLLIPTLHFKYFNHTLQFELSSYFHEKFGCPVTEVKNAIKLADRAQTLFESSLVEEGKKWLDNLPLGYKPLVILGRPYNLTDPFLNLNLVEKLLEQKVFPIPLDYLPLNTDGIFKDYRSMYWPNGQKIIAAARLVKADRRLHAVYLGNFRCGPDSFLIHYVNEEMKGKPYLHLEIDEHSADAGMITRIEAFLDSLKGSEINNAEAEKIFRPRPGKSSPDLSRTLYFPFMNDNAFAISAAARSCGIPSEVLPLQNETDLELGRKYTSSRECFPMICTTGSFLRKLMEPGLDPAHVSFFMPDHNGPCRFGHYNHLQRIIFDRLGFEKAEILTPSNDSSYADIAGKYARKFRLNAWKGFVSVDFLRKLLQENRPYESIPGSTQLLYDHSLQKIVACIESGTNGLSGLLQSIANEFRMLPVDRTVRKPVVIIIGEIFMRDNSYCNGNLVRRLEDLGLETLIAPFAEWINYSTYRYLRDSKWKKSTLGIFKAKVQAYAQSYTQNKLLGEVMHFIDHEKEVPLNEMLGLCNSYVHKDYDGDPPLALGTAAYLSSKNISGIAAILPFTCMPGTLIASVSDSFRKDHHNIPWINMAFDGQDTVTLETRLQAFAYQVKEFAVREEPVQHEATVSV